MMSQRHPDFTSLYVLYACKSTDIRGVETVSQGVGAIYFLPKTLRFGRIFESIVNMQLRIVPPKGANPGRSRRLGLPISKTSEFDNSGLVTFDKVPGWVVFRAPAYHDGVTRDLAAKRKPRSLLRAKRCRRQAVSCFTLHAFLRYFTFRPGNVRAAPAVSRAAPPAGKEHALDWSSPVSVKGACWRSYWDSSRNRAR
jgi:hypothetical protein